MASTTRFRPSHQIDGPSVCGLPPQGPSALARDPPSRADLPRDAVDAAVVLLIGAR